MISNIKTIRNSSIFDCLSDTLSSFILILYLFPYIRS